MPRGHLYINDKDAYIEWGVFLDETALSTLMTPLALKEFPVNKYRTRNGSRIMTNNPRIDSRDITLALNMTANNKETFLSNYAKFCDEVLAKGRLTIRTKFLPNVYYRFVYISCTQFSQFFRQMAKFSLKLTEPDPTNRGKTDNNIEV